jgi:hypothetical protein
MGYEPLNPKDIDSYIVLEEQVDGQLFVVLYQVVLTGDRLMVCRAKRMDEC